MQHNHAKRKMTDDEWWAGFDRELGQVFAGVTRVEAAIFLLLVVLVPTGLMIYIHR